jgi:hypothetical protein
VPLTPRQRRETAEGLAKRLEEIAQRYGLNLRSYRSRRLGTSTRRDRLGPWIHYRRKPPQPRKEVDIRISPDSSHPTCHCNAIEIYQVSFRVRGAKRARQFDARFKEQGVQAGSSSSSVEERTRPLICHRCEVSEELSLLLLEAMREALDIA